jgi:hypothetical protein
MKHERLYLDFTHSIYIVQQLSSGTRSTPAATHGVGRKLIFLTMISPDCSTHVTYEVFFKGCRNHTGGVPGNFI